jgi:hypothetical protein
MDFARPLRDSITGSDVWWVLFENEFEVASTTLTIAQETDVDKVC